MTARSLAPRSSTTRIALATCAEFPSGDEDAGVLLDAFARAGAEAAFAVWDDPAVDWTAFDATFLRSTWDYTPRREEFLGWAGAVPGLLNPLPYVTWSSDKTYLGDLAAAGVATVPTTFVAPGGDLPAGLEGEHVVKPAVSAGSRGAGRFDLSTARADAEAHLAGLHAAGCTALVQPYVAAVDTAGETALVCFDGELSHAARKSALLAHRRVVPLAAVAESGARELFIQETMQPAQPTAAQAGVAADVLEVLATRFGDVPPYARVDLLPGADGPVVVEVELVEPSLFLGYAPDAAAAADRAVAAVLRAAAR